MSPPANIFRFLILHRTELLGQTVEHIGLTFFAMTIATVISLPVGIVLTRHRKAADTVIGGIGVIQTIPSVALLGLLLPLFGIGATPAIIALFLYALLPIVRNTYAGINDVDNSVIESARGMGMTDRQILAKVELPLALPVIFAGIRTATIINVGIATLCALIGSGGLGEFIFRGIALNNTNMILAGAIPAALLALLFDFTLGKLESVIRQIIKPALIGAVMVLFIVVPLLVIPPMFTDTFQAGFTAEFMARADGYPGLKERYGLRLNTVEVDPQLMYQALRDNKVDVISGFSTDGRIQAYNLRVLRDDKQYFPPYQAAPVVRGETIRKYPQLRKAFEKIAGTISNETMRQLNFRVDQHQQDPALVAENYLQEQGFRTDTERTGTPDITIASKNFTEQFILAHIFHCLIENYTELSAELKTGLGGTKICFDALIHGEIDLYPEYTGTGLLVLLNTDQETAETLMQDRQKVYDYVKTEFQEQYDLVWLNPLGFNNTYALLMRESHAEQLDIRTISDLNRYVSEQAGTE
ncbi:MAG TPA: glycine betaine ABC transporter substrate-binding protein [bacterium]|nr:glycine betaine ABC transporter substrate-binding protein [bacterium]